MNEAERRTRIAVRLNEEPNHAQEQKRARYLDARRYDCVVIGSGLRAPEQLLLFEKLINVVHARAVGTKICFNTTPGDTAEAVQRWV